VIYAAIPALAVLLAADLGTAPGGLDLGYTQMYDLQFTAAHKTFADYAQSHPNDPLAPASDAAAYLFAEFDRLQILQSEFFVHDDNFRHPKKLYSDPNVRRAFDAALAKADKIASGVLGSQPRDANALFASIMVLGLRADFDGLIDKHELAAFSSVKTSRGIAERLLAIDPSYYDAHLAVGVENYMLSLKPAPVRWFLQLAGAQADRALGLGQLSITAEKGHLLKPYARLLLAVDALRRKDTAKAREILNDLSRQFPHNRLYAEELARRIHRLGHAVGHHAEPFARREAHSRRPVLELLDHAQRRALRRAEALDLGARSPREGRLVPLLTRHLTQRESIYIYYRHRTEQPLRVRTFIDFMIEKLADNGDFFLSPAELRAYAK